MLNIWNKMKPRYITSSKSVVLLMTNAAHISDDEAIDDLKKENEEQRVKIKCLRNIAIKY